MKLIPIKTFSKSYNIFLGYNIISKLKNILKKEKINFKKILIVADSKVPEKFIKKIKSVLNNKNTFIFKFNASEKNKNLISINQILNTLFNKNFTRNDVIICVGGGIAGDVSGFASSIFKRGVKFVNIPSTLLSQVDSSIGGKTGVNNKYGKNLIGSFYQPDIVISDIKLLESLPKREIVCGYAEIFKHSLIKNKKFFLFLDKNLKNILELKKKLIEKAILESCKIKKKIVEQDENENNLRKSLNLGHTFGHAFEATLNYSNKLNHGEAVLYGIFSATKLSNKLKTINKTDYKLILNHISKLNYNNLNKFFKKKDLNKIVKFMTSDKKNTSKKINFITLNKIGEVNISNQLNPVNVKQFLKKELIN